MNREKKKSVAFQIEAGAYNITSVLLGANCDCTLSTKCTVS